MPRIKPAPTTRDDVERLVGEIAQLTNEERRIKTEIDDAIISARSRNEFVLSQIDDDLKEKAAIVKAWAESHRAEFGSKKSLELTQGIIGFRIGTPKLKTLPRRTFQGALDFLMSVGWGKRFVRTTNELNKLAILEAHARDAFPDDTLKSIGLYVAQEESFFIEPKLEDTTPTIKEPVS
jgi:phage host-nuclease inhibitor protein Gam